MKKILQFTAICMALLVAWLAWRYSTPVVQAAPFDKARWLAAAAFDEANDPGCYRGAMAVGLVDSRWLNDKTGPDVVSLIGAPSNSSAGSWIYPVGQCGMLWEHFYLRVDFGPAGAVTRAVVAKD